MGRVSGGTLMAEIIKTWPAFMAPDLVRKIFEHKWGRFYFSLGRGKPQLPVGHIWFTHRGVLLGKFTIDELVRNEGQLPKLRSLSNRVSEWQIKPLNWVAICSPPIQWLEERIYHESFRGWRYFTFTAYRETVDATINLEASGEETEARA